MKKGFVIAIDGPVASGKGTVAPKLAEKIQGFHLYTGGTYRAIAKYCLDNGINLDDISAISNALSEIHIDLIDDGVILNGDNITEDIKSPEVASATSIISVLRPVREAMVGLQRQIAQRVVNEGRIVIAEGRDTATKVFPDSDIKIYLNAKPEIRAERRLEQYKLKGYDTDFEKVLEETLERDKRDTEREIDPLVKDPEDYGYIIIDSSDQSVDETTDIIIEDLKERGINL